MLTLSACDSTADCIIPLTPLGNRYVATSLRLKIVTSFDSLVLDITQDLNDLAMFEIFDFRRSDLKNQITYHYKGELLPQKKKPEEL